MHRSVPLLSLENEAIICIELYRQENISVLLLFGKVRVLLELYRYQYRSTV